MALNLALVFRWVAYALAAIWLFSGFQKLVAPDDFVAIVRRHGLLQAQLADLSWLIGLLECALGLGLVLTISKPASLRIVCGAAVVLLVGFCWYLVMVDQAAFIEVGCGCQLLVARTFERASKTRAYILTFDAVLIAAHVLLAVFAKYGKQDSRACLGPAEPTAFGA